MRSVVSVRGFGTTIVVLALGLLMGSDFAQEVDGQGAVVKRVLVPGTAGHHLAVFSEPARKSLEAVLYADDFVGVIKPDIVTDVLRLEGGSKTIEQFMADMLPLARLYSMPPTSGFRFGAVCQGRSGAIYFGANLEIPGAPLGFAVHAEQSAILNAHNNRESGVQRLTVTAPPCGHCRQFLNELTTAPELQIIVAGKAMTTLPSLFPDSFGPSDLGVDARLLGERQVSLASSSGPEDFLAEAALDAARRSYAPYTRAHSGLACRLEDGTVFVGSYIESAAYNPSVPPMLAAIDRLRFSGRSYEEISDVVLVEIDGASISQFSITRLLLQTAAPRAGLRLVQARLALE